MERRVYKLNRCEVRAGTDGKPSVFEGHAIVFDEWSDDLGGFREKVAPEAVDRVLGEGQDVRFLQNHDSNLLLGRTASGTLELAKDGTGLAVRAELPDTSYANDLTVLMERGDISQMSFGFETVADDWVRASETEDGLAERTLLDLDLFDVSVVTFPAYPQTDAAVRMKLRALRAMPALRSDSWSVSVLGSMYSLGAEFISAESRPEDAPEVVAMMAILDSITALMPDEAAESYDQVVSEEVLLLIRALPALREGKVLSASNKELVQAAQDALTELLSTAESQGDQGPLSETKATPAVAIAGRRLGLLARPV